MPAKGGCGPCRKQQDSAGEARGRPTGVHVTLKAGYRKWRWDSRPRQGEHAAAGGHGACGSFLGFSNKDSLKLCIPNHVCRLCVLRELTEARGSFPRATVVSGKEENAGQRSRTQGTWTAKNLQLNPNSNI